MITIKATKYSEAREDGVAEKYTHGYRDREGLTRIESCTYQSTSDFSDGKKQRISHDNGKTWGEWEDVYEQSGFETHGSNERIFPARIQGVWNPVHKHYVGVATSRIFNGNHIDAYQKMWAGERGYTADHAYLGFRTEDGQQKHQLVKYEEGADFDSENPLHPDHFFKNNCQAGTNLLVEESGDILFPIGVRVAKCCEIAGVDVKEYCASSPLIIRNMIVMRGVWNGEGYDLTPSRPILISDLQSSRGIDEPAIAKLKSGRILIVFRGANTQLPKWNSRIEPGTPAFKWYTYSDDGGKTFVPPMPWHFDDGEVIYSPASIARFWRDERNGRLYWIGNITDHKIFKGSFPRFPLCIVEVDETYGTAKKGSFTVIDTQREGEPNTVQLSNFNVLQDRETGHLEIRLNKIGQFPGPLKFKSESWHYEIILPD